MFKIGQRRGKLKRSLKNAGLFYIELDFDHKSIAIAPCRGDKILLHGEQEIRWFCSFIWNQIRELSDT